MDGFRPDQRKHDSQPEWRQNALEGLSAEDRQIVLRMRQAFEKRNLGNEWVYEGAGTDMVPLLLAPDGTHLSFYDPFQYEDPQPLQEHLQKTPLADYAEAPTERMNSARLTLPGGTRVDYQNRFGGEREPSEQRIDVIYTNTITQVLSPAVLDQLRDKGVIVVAGATARSLALMDHPMDAISPSQMGIRTVQTDIEIKRMNPKGYEKTTQYGYGAPHTFAVFEKTREFTEEETAALHVNRVMRDLFNVLRGPIYSGVHLDDDPAKHADGKEWLRHELQQSKKELSQLSTEQKSVFTTMLQTELNKLFGGQHAADVVMRLFKIEAATGYSDFVKFLPVEHVVDYIGYMNYFIDAVISIFQEEMGVSVNR